MSVRWIKILTAIFCAVSVQLLSGASRSLRAQQLAAPSVTETAFQLASGEEMRYAISVPAGYDASEANPRPLILALHPGGRSRYYGSSFMQTIVEPALRSWEAVIVAPDVPERSWSTPGAERAVLALLDDVTSRYAIDRGRVLVTGFSMGGRGTWYLATRNSERFTAAIALAGSPAEQNLDALATMPLYLIHSPDDEVVPYGPVEETAEMLAGRGYPVHLLRVPGAGHYMMGAYVGPLQTAGEWVTAYWSGS